jgi:hypothetical protein
VRKLFRLVPLFLLLSVLAIGTGAGGCKSAPQTAYVVGQTTTITVESAMGLWAAYVAQKHPSAATEQRVKTAYEQYQRADILLLQAGRAMLATQTPGTAALTNWQQAEAALAASAGQIYSLLTELGIKLP